MKHGSTGSLWRGCVVVNQGKSFKGSTYVCGAVDRYRLSRLIPRWIIRVTCSLLSGIKSACSRFKTTHWQWHEKRVSRRQGEYMWCLNMKIFQTWRTFIVFSRKKTDRNSCVVKVWIRVWTRDRGNVTETKNWHWKGVGSWSYSSVEESWPLDLIWFSTVGQFIQRCVNDVCPCRWSDDPNLPPRLDVCQTLSFSKQAFLDSSLIWMISMF